MPIRFDTSRGELTAAGGKRYDALVTRAGVLTYRRQDGSRWREYRPPEEVFDSESLATLRDAPVTDDHPTEMVTPDTFRTVSRGHVSGDPCRDGERVAAQLAISDGGLLARVASGKREASCGYRCDVDSTPGVTPEGERYDAVQRNIRYNHVAIVHKGRAGSEIGIRLDSEGNQIPMSEKRIERIDGAEYEIGTEAHAAAVARRDSAAADITKQIETLRAERDAAVARADELTAKLPELVSARAELLGEAARLDADVATEASERDIKVAILGKLAPAVAERIDSNSTEAYIDAALDIARAHPVDRTAVARSQMRGDSVSSSNGPRVVVAAPGKSPADIARREMIKARRAGKDS